MMQAEILYDLCNRLQKEHISVAFETALAFPWKVIHRMTECADLFLVDFKMFDNEKHKEYTGTENTLIKENLKKLVNYRPIMIRLPIIKGINDEIENAVATADFFAALGRNIKSVEFLPYHDFGVEKAKHVGVNQQMFEAPDEKQLELLKEVYRSKKWQPEDPETMTRKTKWTELLDCVFSENTDGIGVQDLPDEGQRSVEDLVILQAESAELHQNIAKLSEHA